MSLEEPVSTSTEKEEDKREERRRLLIAILFLLLSFSCIFCSSQTALWFVDRDSIRGSMLSSQSADYGFDPALALAPLSGDIAAEAEHDEALLQQVQTPIAQGLAIAVLPNPVPTLAPTPSPVPLITPTPTLTPSVVPATPVAGAPTSTSAPATPGPIPPTVVTAPPTVSSPTSPAPVVSPTAIPTNPATEIPTNTPTDPATDTPTDSPTDTTPNTPTHTPTNTPTPTPTNTPTSIPTGTPLPPSVSFSAPAYSAGEGSGSAIITVRLSAPSTQIVTVDYGTINGGTATAGSDYTPTNGTLTFAPGEIDKTFNVAIINDAVANEAIETVLLQLSNPTNATLGLSNATLAIVDNDAPLVQFSSGSYNAGEADGQATITVVLNTPSAQTITVDYGTINGGTATAGSDYTPTNGTLTFAPGETSKTFDVAILDDAVANEATETVLLQLSNPTNATLGLSDATLEIVDDDPLPLVQFSSGSYSISEDAGLAPITVTLSSLSALTVTVDYTTSNGTAFAGADYLTTNGTLTFPPGTTDQLFDVPIIDDAGLETPDETLTITLSSPVDATLGSPNPATLTIIDDGDTGSCNTAIYTDFVEIGPPDCKWTVLTNTFVVIDLATQAGTAINVNGDGNSDYDLVVYERETTLAPSSIAMDRMTVELSIDGITWHTVLLWGDGTLDVNTNIGQAGYGPPNENDDTIIPMSDPPLYGPAGGIISGIAIDVDNPPSGPPLPAGAYRYVRITDTPGPAIQPTELDSIEILP